MEENNQALVHASRGNRFWKIALVEISLTLIGLALFYFTLIFKTLLILAVFLLALGVGLQFPKFRNFYRKILDLHFWLVPWGKEGAIRMYTSRLYSAGLIAAGILLILLSFGPVTTTLSKIIYGGGSCTLEAKICPNGTSVSRIGPRCEFDPCPTPRAANPDSIEVNWKMYIDTKHGYSIKYPADRFTNCSKDIGFYLYEGAEGSRKCALGEETPEFLIVNTLDGTGNFQTSNYPNCYSVQKETLTVDGKPATKYSNTVFNDKGNCNNFTVGGAKNEIHVILYKDNIPYNIVFYDDKNKDLKYQILSTFKFTDSTLTPTPTCMNRPACLDATPRCLIAEPANGWCPETSPTTNEKQSCSSNSDCPSGDTCSVWGPIPVNGAPNKYCTAPGQAVPL